MPTSRFSFIRHARTLALSVAFVVAASFATAAEVRVFAAASLSDALTELAKTYEAKSGDKLQFNFAASSALARQIKEGAPADVFFSADEAKMNDLAKAGLVATDTRSTLLSNTLVIVARPDSKVTLTKATDLAQVTRLALGETQTVPAGIYAREYLQKIGLWEKLAPKVVATESVRACLAAVESGNVDAGIVYKTDALISKKVAIVVEIPANEGPQIAYPLAVVKDSKVNDAARKFVTFLTSAEAKSVFTRYGFLPAP